MSTDDPRRSRLLEAALGVFLRYGYKKTSMDEVARAADLSRQGLYLHFATKGAVTLSTKGADGNVHVDCVQVVAAP